MKQWRGLGVSPGIGIGWIVRMSARGERVFRFRLNPSQVEHEVKRLTEAIDKTRQQLLQIKSKLEQTLGSAHAYILDAHLLMLEDRQLVEEIRTLIRYELVNAEWAVKTVTDRILASYAEIKDEYLCERGSDVRDVMDRLTAMLRGDHPPQGLPQQTILVAQHILPSIMAELDVESVVGLVAQAGGRTSHAAIIARSLGIPAVVGIDQYEEIEAGAAAIIDGQSGLLILHPTDETVRQYQHRQTERERLWSFMQARAQLPAQTCDGIRITLRANIELPSECNMLAHYSAQGIGLFRTQYLFLSRAADELPSEEEQFNVYRQLAQACGTDGVGIRTFDWAETGVAQSGRELEINPALGLRAIRFSLQARDVFRTQLRAILRAACYGSVRVVLPLVSTITELRQARQILQQAAQELTAEGVAHQDNVPIGVMIEVPAAVMIADVLAAESDFFSLGTNDLIQYLLAVDRDNTQVAYLYKALHPALLRAIKQTVDAATHANIPVEVCGEMASDPLHALVLIGLGVRSLSMAPKFIPFIKDIIRCVDAATLQQTVKRALNLSSTEQVEALLHEEWHPFMQMWSEQTPSEWAQIEQA